MRYNISAHIQKNVYKIITMSLTVPLCILYILLLAGCSADANSDTIAMASYKDTGFAMGTVVNQTIYSEDVDIAPRIINLLTETENKWISWRAEDSEIAKINDNSQNDDFINISDETHKYITYALSIAKKSDGAFDPTIGMLSRLWDFDNGKNAVPPDEDIKNILKNIDYKNINIHGNKVELREDTSIDLGAIGKGIGCDEIEKYLNTKSSVTGALINIGGSSILTYGSKGKNDPWKVAVLDPRSDDYLGYMEIEGTNHISTSGDYEKYFEKNGQRYHHILDPSTGYPADSGLMSVTVITNNGAESDSLSTACFVLGKDKAVELLKNYDAEAIFVDKNKNVYITDGIRNKFTLTADGYELRERP